MKKHMQRVLVLALAPLLMATQCEDDFETTGFETTYLIQNDSSSDVYLLTDESNFVEITRASNVVIGSTLNSETEAVLPTDAFLFNTIKLYISENDNFILVYEQDPIDDNAWQLSEPTINRFEYTLMVTDNLID